MVVWQWLTKFLLLFFVTGLSSGFRFFPEDEFLGAPITDKEIQNMLQEEAEENMNLRAHHSANALRKSKIPIHKGNRSTNATAKSKIPVHKGKVLTKEEELSLKEFHAQIAALKFGSTGKREIDEGCFEKSDGDDGSEVYTAQEGDTCRHAVNTVLEEKGGGKTLEDLTANYFNGETYVISSFSESDGKLSAITAEAPVPVDLFSKLVLGSEDNPSTLKLEFGDWEEEGDNELSFKSVAITVEGKCRIKVSERTLPYDIETELEKPADSEVFDIKKFDFTGQAVKWLELIDLAQDKAAEWFDFEKEDMIGKIGEELEGFTGFGAFNNEEDYQFGIVAEGDVISNIGGAKKLTILYSQNHLKGGPDITIFLEFDKETQLIEGIANLLGDDGGLDETFMLNKVSSEKWCVLLVTGTTKYLDPIKSKLEECLGSTKDELEAGIHFYVELDFQEVLKGCGASDEEVADLETQVGIYATINKKGVSIGLPNGVETPMDLIMKCGDAAIEKNLPEFMSTSMVKLTEIDMNTKERLLKFALEIELTEEYKTIPGTSISLEKFILKAERKSDEENNKKYWDISAHGEVMIGEANFDLNMKKTKTDYMVKLSVDQFTLADLISSFNFVGSAELLEREVFKTLGIKDFSVEIHKGGDNPGLKVRGTPLIFGYDNLHFNAIIKIEAPSERRRKRRNANQKNTIKRSSIEGINVPSPKRVRRSSQTGFAIALFLDGANFDSIMGTFSGNEETSLCWLTDLKAVVVVSTTSGKVTSGSDDDEEEDESDDEQTDEKARAKTKRSAPQQRTRKRLQKVSKFSSVVQSKDVLKKRTTAGNSTDTQFDEDEGNTQLDEDEGGEGDDDGDDGDDGVELKFPTLGDDFEDTKFDVGLTFGVAWRIPDEKEKCGTNNLCEWMVDNLGSDFIFTLKGAVGRSSLKIEGKLEGYAVLQKTEDESELAFTSLKLVIDVPSICIEASMQYKDKSLGAWERPLIFKGSVSASPMEIKLGFSMKNFIYPTELTEHVAVGDMSLGIGYTFGAPFPSLTFGAVLKLGKLDPETENEEAIEITGHFGINPTSPGENWVYGSVSRLTVGQICTAFQLNCDHISSSFKESGFPNGITASYSSKDREVEPIGEIPQGLSVKGTINFMGFECVFDLSVSSEEFKLSLEMAPIDWAGGLIVVSRTEEDQENGPKAEIMIKNDGEFSVAIKGYCSFLAIIKASVDIEITNTHVKFEIEGPLIPAILDVNIKVEANYGGSSDMGFSFSATLKSNDDFQEKLLNAIKEFLEKIKEMVEETINKAKETLEHAKKKLDVAKQKVDDWQKSIDDWKASLEKRKQELQDEAAKSPPCDCPQVCFPFLKWEPFCWKVWGHWMGCPVKDPCYSMVEDVGCYISCAATMVVSALVSWAKQAVLEITSLVADGARALGNLAKGILMFAKGFLTAAQAALDFVNEKIKWALDAVTDFIEGLLTKFKLHHLTISASLSADYSACVSYDLSLLFMVNVTSSGQACLEVSSFMGSMAKGVTEGPDSPDGLKSEDGKPLSSAEDSTNEAKGRMLGVTKSETELVNEEDQVTSKVDKETAKTFQDGPEKRQTIESLNRFRPILERLPKRQTVPTEEEMEIHRLINEPIPAYNMAEDPNLRSIDQNAPWKALDMHKQPFGFNETATLADERDKRDLDFDEKLSPCHRMKRALNGYSQLTDGLLVHASYLENGVSVITSERKAEKELLRRTRSRIESDVREHNMTIDQRENAYYLYRKAHKGYGELAKKSDVILTRENSFALPVIRRQLNTVLGREKGSSFMKFTEHMHDNAMRGYKRSTVPHPADVKGEKLLTTIKQDIQSIVTDEKKDLITMTDRIKKVKKNIIAMKPYTKQCEK